MHGIVHKTLKEYVIERTDEETWTSIIDRTDIEPSLYLPVSHYDDAEIDMILAAVTEMAVQDRRTIERDFGRTLAPELLSTFDAYVKDDWTFVELLSRMQSVARSVDESTPKATVPDVSCRQSGDAMIVTYRSERDYCGLAHGILEGIATEYSVGVVVSEEGCVHDGDDACTFRIEGT